MSFVDYLWWKLIALGILAFIVNFVYTLRTGKSIEEARREKDRADKSKGQ